jgi:hypothetical protein
MPSAPPDPLHDRFLADILANPFNRAILAAWDDLALPDGWLVAGCLFQTAWNLKAGRDPVEGIRDYDVFYFDATDLSGEGEARVQRRVDERLGALGVAVEARNQARVHLWYPAYFGHPYPALGSAREGIARFLVPATCVGVRPNGGGLELHAPNGLEDLYAGRLAPNPLTPHLDLFRAKAASYRSRWEWLQVDDTLKAG